MNSPRPCPYHQKAIAEAIRKASSDLAMRLRSSVRCAMSVIVAWASRGARRRRGRRLACSVTVLLPGGGRSARPLADALLVRAGTQGGGARLGQAGLLDQLRREVTGGGAGRGAGRCGRRDDLGADRCGGRRVLGADVVVLHAFHLALEDPQRPADRAGGVGQLL